ncbi:AAA family ATPase [Desulfosporosinus nitroreducens]|uniref:AAA family ATPase n=1 Tax=Desulfosporosinus nitroreducens TaxID=2018668 RepID=UPI00207D143E|nr:ATP-binding protein [Desulfosporosinus nitroreducens]MCO1601465.1 ATP-binding protein [Desulfosporosinus nitroreducens]
MLLEFKAKNYKSFKDELVFTMVPAPKQKGLNYSILNQKIGSKKYKGLSSAVIYGPNASGKTNIIGAMEAYKSIILRGNIRNADVKNAPNPAGSTLELIPNSSLTELNPVDFAIKFIENKLLIQYDLSIDIGNFLDAEYPRRILSETLTVNEEMVFSRKEKLEFGSLKTIKDYLINEFEENSNSATSLARSNLNQEEMFLTNGFKAMFSSKLVNLILNWLENKFMVIYRADTLHLIQKFADPRKHTVYIEKTTNDAAQLFGINSNALGYVVSEDDLEAKLCSIFKNKKAVIAAEMFESYGTIRFVNMFPLVIKAILTGGTLVVDEFDASLHPMALMSIISIFHNDDINRKNAQLIFNTHNPIFLNSNLFRRDEIKFVERDDETHFSKHYSLSDFGTTGEKGVRLHEDYMHNYFISQYGAINDIDFTSIFEKLVDENEVLAKVGKDEIE